jgi:hypothetical protein
MAISNTINQFRADVLAQGGPQLASLYRVNFVYPGGSLVAYPASIVLPGRSYSFYEHTLWGPSRRVPYSRLYTPCNMTFNIYQDWSEKNFMENWMNTVVKFSKGGASQRNYNKAIPPAFGNGSTEGTDQNSSSSSPLSSIVEGAIEFAKSFGSNREKSANFGNNVFDDWVNYGSRGRIFIEFLNTSKTGVNHRMVLNEAFPATISQIAVGADATGYPTFTIGFQFFDYSIG